MRRAIVLMPADTDFEALPEAVQQHLNDVGFQYIAPMPNTRIIDGMMVADGIAHTDELTPEDFQGLGWQLLYYAEYTGAVHQPMNWETYMQYVNDTPIYNEDRSEEHTSELQSRGHLVCRLLLDKKKRIETEHILI